MPNVDWAKIKAEYLRGGISYRKLAQKHGINASTLMGKAATEGWKKSEQRVASKAQAKAERKIVSQRAKDIAALDNTRSLLIEKLKKSVERFPDIPGNRMEQTSTEAVGVSEITDGADKVHYVPKQKSVRLESDILKMVSALDKLMELTGYNVISDNDADDGFIAALRAESVEVTDDAADIPEDTDIE